MARLVCIPLVLLLVCSCDVFVTGVGGVGEPCFGDDTCYGGLTCSESGVCTGSCPACVTGWKSITGGTFYMGSDSGGADEKPVHPVTVPSFEMMETEVTVELYRLCVEDLACTKPDTASQCNWNRSGRDDHPVNCVDWQQAVDFCRWAGGRLPSEAEWEYAARSAGQDILYPWGNDLPTCSRANYSGCEDDTWMVCNAATGNTSQGLCDMGGNVWEWVQDRYHDNYTGAPSNGSAWESPPGDYRVLRGGSWYVLAGGLRTSYRNQAYPDAAFSYYGFRCAR
jgi:formylglycine-generating enzyme required for sulfatase activity